MKERSKIEEKGQKILQTYWCKRIRVKAVKYISIARKQFEKMDGMKVIKKKNEEKGETLRT